MEPEDSDIPLLVRSGYASFQKLGNFSDQDCALDGLCAPGRIVPGQRDEIHLQLFHVAGAALPAVAVGLTSRTNANTVSASTAAPPRSAAPNAAPTMADSARQAVVTRPPLCQVDHGTFQSP